MGLTAAALISALALSACGGDAAGDEEDEITSSGDGELFDLLPEDVQESGVLTVATDANYPPVTSWMRMERSLVITMTSSW